MRGITPAFFKTETDADIAPASGKGRVKRLYKKRSTKHRSPRT